LRIATKPTPSCVATAAPSTNPRDSTPAILSTAPANGAAIAAITRANSSVS